MPAKSGVGQGHAHPRFEKWLYTPNRKQKPRDTKARVAAPNPHRGLDGSLHAGCEVGERHAGEGGGALEQRHYRGVAAGCLIIALNPGSEFLVRAWEGGGKQVNTGKYGREGTR